MAGLLDYVFNSPEGRMGLGLLALGQMPKSQGMQGLMGLLASQDAAAKSKADSAWQEEARGRQRKEWSQADAESALAPQFFKPAQPGLAPLMGDQEAGIMPSAGRPGVQASFDMPGYAQAMMGVNPMKGMQLMQSLQKELPVDKINPEKFTPASLAKFAQTRNFGDLVPRDKLEFVEGVGVNPYDPANANRAIPNPNKPFAMDASGNIVPNRAYQDYEIRKAGAGAARTNVSVNTEKSFLNEIAGGLGKQIEASTGQARAASDSLRTIGALNEALNSGKVMAGPATKPAMLLTQLGAQLGIVGKDQKETLEKTRSAMQQMAQLELDAAQQMKGQGSITENERDTIRRAASGDISMTLPELQTLTKALEKTARFRIDQHNARVQPLLNNPNASALAPFLTVPAPQAAPANVVDFGSLK